MNLASKPFYSVADRILGSQFLEDIAEFFMLFQTMYDGFVERAEAVTTLLGGPQTTFVVVSTLEVAPAREAEFFLELLAERRYHVGALVLNKVLPEFLLGPHAAGCGPGPQRIVSDELAPSGSPRSLGEPASGGVPREPRAVGDGVELPRLPGRRPPRGRATPRARRPRRSWS